MVVVFDVVILMGKDAVTVRTGGGRSVSSKVVVGYGEKGTCPESIFRSIYLGLNLQSINLLT